MVAARSAAMGFNRLVDARLRRAESAHRDARAAARRDDARAKRSCSWSSRRSCSSCAAWRLGTRLSACCRRSRWRSCSGIRSRSAFTSYTQLFLGLAMAVAPVGGWLAAGGRGGWEPWLLGAGDRHVGRRLRRALRLSGPRLRSARTACDRSRCASASRGSLRDFARDARGRPSSASLALGVGRGPRSASTWRASPASRSLLVYEQSLVSEHDLSQVKRAFDLNGYVGILYLVATAAAYLCPTERTSVRSRAFAMAITGASGAIYADAHHGGAARAGLPPRGRDLATTASACCATSSANGATVDRLREYLVGKYGEGVAQGTYDALQQQGPRRDDRQRQPRTAKAMVDRAVFDEDARRRRARPVAQPRRARRGRDAEGAAPPRSSCRARRR